MSVSQSLCLCLFLFLSLSVRHSAPVDWWLLQLLSLSHVQVTLVSLLHTVTLSGDHAMTKLGLGSCSLVGFAFPCYYYTRWEGGNGAGGGNLCVCVLQMHRFLDPVDERLRQARAERTETKRKRKK